MAYRASCNCSSIDTWPHRWHTDRDRRMRRWRQQQRLRHAHWPFRCDTPQANRRNAGGLSNNCSASFPPYDCIRTATDCSCCARHSGSRIDRSPRTWRQIAACHCDSRAVSVHSAPYSDAGRHRTDGMHLCHRRSDSHCTQHRNSPCSNVAALVRLCLVLGSAMRSGDFCQCLNTASLRFNYIIR